MRWATVLAMAAVVEAGPAPKALEIAELIRETGARETLVALEADAALWEAVVEGVASGRPEWLDVGRELRRYTDDEASEWLDLALSEALLPAAEAVLRIADGTVWHVDDFCGTIGFAERGASDGDLIAAYLDSRREALVGVRGSELADRRDRCLAALSATRRDLLGTGYEPGAVPPEAR